MKKRKKTKTKTKTKTKVKVKKNKVQKEKKNILKEVSSKSHKEDQSKPLQEEKIEIKKIYFSTGEPFNKEDGEESVDIEQSLKSEEWWVSTEVDNDDKPFGYVNIDLNSISELLEETSEDTSKDWFFYFKRLKQDEITSTVWKVVMHTILVKVFKKV